MYENVSYIISEFNLHAPSEHTINGRNYPLEVHFISQSNTLYPKK